MELPPLTAIFEPGEDGWIVATCPELGIVSQGESMEHAETMIKEAVELWLETSTDAEISQRLAAPKIAVKPLAFRMPKLRVFSGAELWAICPSENAEWRPALWDSRHRRPDTRSGVATDVRSAPCILHG